MLSNCNHTKSHIIPRVVENLNKHGYVEMNKVLKVQFHLWFYRKAFVLISLTKKTFQNIVKNLNKHGCEEMNKSLKVRFL